MLLLTNAGAAPDKLQLITSAAATVDVHASYVDASNANPPIVQGDTMGRQNTAITTAATTDIVAAPAANEIRNVKTLHVRNKHATVATDVTVVYNANGTSFELHKEALQPGEALEYVEGVGFFAIAAEARLDQLLVTTADVVSAVTTFADITGLTIPVEADKTYCFESHLTHVSNATTTGARFAVNGPAMTFLRASTIDTVTGSVTASAHSAGSVTALDTAITAQTTGSAADTLAVIAGAFSPSAAGTFAMRLASEVAVASGLTVRRGSHLHIREADNT